MGRKPRAGRLGQGVVVVGQATVLGGHPLELLTATARCALVGELLNPVRFRPIVFRPPHALDP